MGSSLVRDSYSVGTLSKFFTHNCSAILTASVLPRSVSALLNFLLPLQYQSSVVLYNEIMLFFTASFNASPDFRECEMLDYARTATNEQVEHIYVARSFP